MTQPSSPKIEELLEGDQIWISQVFGHHDVRTKGFISHIEGPKVQLDGDPAKSFNLEFVNDFGYADRSKVPPKNILAPAADIRMDAYYYGFEKTGIGVIDEILSAVAIAGKHLHSTEDWASDSEWYVEHGGLNEEQRIQQAANKAAAAIRAAFESGKN